jgi:hypothetical protein
MQNVGGKLVGMVSTIADIHMIIIQVLCSELYKTNFGRLIPPSITMAPVSRGVAATDYGGVRSGVADCVAAL